MLSKTKCRLGANRETSPRNDDPLNLDSLITASKWTSCNAEWQNKISSLCLNTVAGYSEEAPSILWVYHSYAYQYLLALVALISRWIQNFRWAAGLTFGAFHDWSIEQSVSEQTFLTAFLGQLQQDLSDYEQSTPEYTYQRNETVFFPENSTDFVFQKLPEEIQSKIVYFYSVINEYSLRSRDMTLHAILLTKMIRFWKRLWCLAIVVRTRTEFSSLNYSFVVLWSWRVRQTPQEARVVKPWH